MQLRMLRVLRMLSQVRLQVILYYDMHDTRCALYAYETRVCHVYVQYYLR